jgi:hypothetical protein
MKLQPATKRSTEDLLEEYSRIFVLTGEAQHAHRVRDIMKELDRRGAMKLAPGSKRRRRSGTPTSPSSE